MTGESSPSSLSSVCLYMRSSPPYMKSGYAIIPTGCSPLHVALHPHLVRKVPHQHPHHPQTGNSPTNPYSPVLRVLGHLEDVETYVDKANVSSQLQKVHNLHVLIKALKPFPPYVVLKDHVGVVHLPLLAL